MRNRINTSINQNNNSQNSVSIAESTIKVIAWILGIGIPILVTFLGWIGYEVVNLKTIAGTNTSKISSIDEDLKLIKTGLNGDSATNGIYTRLMLIEKELGIKTLAATSDVLESIEELSIVYNEVHIVSSPVPSKTEIGVDKDGKIYMTEDLIDQTVLLTYREGSKDVYFLGQYNKDCHWNGLCITNVYDSNGILNGICESNFDENGKRLDYKSICVSEYGVKNEWVFSDRICEDGKNTGININYSFEYNKEKNFTNTNVRVFDIMYVDDFFKTIPNPSITRYYYGDTSEKKKYHDETGNAYLVLYNEDGTIKTLYNGNFVDGKFKDETGNAWKLCIQKMINVTYIKKEYLKIIII